MQIPFYQTTWHGIDLISLAKKIGHPIQKTANARFYSSFYKELSKEKKLSNDWVNKKALISKWLGQKISELSLSDKKILSVGAGTGIVEMPLIEKGMNIDLHDVQSQGFKITGVEKKTKCNAGSLSEVSGKYDALISIAACYTMSDKELGVFFADCSKLLRKGGFLIILDTSLSWYEIYSWLRNKDFFSKNYLLWGHKRSIGNISKLSGGKFRLKGYDFYDRGINCLNAFKFLNIPLNITPSWQSLIFEKKHD